MLRNCFRRGKNLLIEIATFIDMFVITSEVLAIGSRRNNCCGVHGLDPRQDAVGVNVLHAVNGIGHFGDIVSLTAGQAELGQIGESIKCGTDLCIQSPTRATNTLFSVFLGEPAACWCTRTIVLPRNTFKYFDCAFSRLLISYRASLL